MTALTTLSDGRARRLSPAATAVCLLMTLYAAYNGWLAVMRHETFGTNAMDMGYTDQAVWNTLHGRILEISTLENVRIDLPLSEFRRTDTLLAYHVELLLVPLSGLYLLWSSPVALLLLQVIVITGGAGPLYLLAREHLASEWAGAALSLAYLLAPAVQGAVLADMHAVSLTSCLLIWASYLIEKSRWRSLAAVLAVCLLAKEDLSLIVFMLGAWLFLVRHERRRGALCAAVGLAWLALCTLVILPHHNGLPISPYLGRLAIFGPTVRESVLAAAADPGLIIRWLWRPEIRGYLGGLLASGGWLGIIAPETLAIAAAPLAMNVFSAWPWTYSGGEHYSATIIPVVMVAAVCGLGRVARWASPRMGQPVTRVTHALCLVLVLMSAGQSAREGVWPWSRRFAAPEVTEHVAIGREIIDLIPSEASVSAQTGLYPHLSQRERAYLFPAVNEAQYVLLDVTGTSYPLTVEALHDEACRLLRSSEYGIVAAQDGYLLLERGRDGANAPVVPRSLASFALGDPNQVQNPLGVRFGEALELVGWDLRYLNVVSLSDVPIRISLWWRVLQDLPQDVQFPLYFTQRDGAIVYVYDGETATTLWYPPSVWRAGELIRIESPVLSAGALEDLLVAVVPAGEDIWDQRARLPVTVGRDGHAQVVDGGTLYRLTRLP